MAVAWVVLRPDFIIERLAHLNNRGLIAFEHNIELPNLTTFDSGIIQNGRQPNTTCYGLRDSITRDPDQVVPRLDRVSRTRNEISSTGRTSLVKERMRKYLIEDRMLQVAYARQRVP